jgi:branched-chain amino acid transport system ATP-binding protein
MTLLRIDGLTTSFGQNRVHNQLCMEAEENEIVGILGHNGAGKTVLLRAIVGLKHIDQGVIEFRSEDITNWEADRVAAIGISMVPQGRMIFSGLTVHENLEMGGYLTKNVKKLKEQIAHVYEFFPMLHERRSSFGGELSGGQQQILAIARGLIRAPVLLLLDEPSLGLSPIAVKHMRETILNLKKEFNTGILIVEQNISLAFSVIERGYLLKQGEVVAEGTLTELKSSGAMESVYLGDTGGKWGSSV